MGLFGPSKADHFEQELMIQRDVNWGHRRYIKLLEAMIGETEPQLLKLKKAHQEAWEDAHRNLDGTLNFSRPSDERQYQSTMAKLGYYS